MGTWIEGYSQAGWIRREKVKERTGKFHFEEGAQISLEAMRGTYDPANCSDYRSGRTVHGVMLVGLALNSRDGWGDEIIGKYGLYDDEMPYSEHRFNEEYVPFEDRECCDIYGNIIDKEYDPDYLEEVRQACIEDDENEKDEWPHIDRMLMAEAVVLVKNPFKGDEYEEANGYDPFYDQDMDEEADMEAVLADREEALVVEKLPSGKVIVTIIKEDPKVKKVSKRNCWYTGSSKYGNWCKWNHGRKKKDARMRCRKEDKLSTIIGADWDAYYGYKGPINGAGEVISRKQQVKFAGTIKNPMPPGFMMAAN